MKKSLPFVLFPFLLLAGSIRMHAQDSKIIAEYIDHFKELAIAEMQRTGVPASIKLAQGIHETMAGTSELVLKSNNHFGIKCKTNWMGESVSHDDDARGECFRKYSTAQDSYRDHSDFLRGSTRYANLFGLDPTDYSGWAYGLKKAGYATNPRYPAIIIKLVEDYNLQDYTLIALGRKKADPNNDIVLARTEQEVTKQPEVSPVVESVTYPTGEFRINETRVIYAKKGESYLSIAEQYRISLSRLFEFNEMKQAETAPYDHLVYLQRKRRTGNADFHVVKPGETLWDIAQQQAMRLESLQEYNWLRGDMKPAIGERLWLRSKATAMPRLALKNDYSIMPSDRGWNNN